MNTFSLGRPLPLRRRRGLRVIIALSIIAFLNCWGARPSRAARGWGIDEAHTSIGFKINAIGFPTTQGHFNHYSGRILIDVEHPSKSFTSFTVDSTSVDLGSKPFNDFVKSTALLNAEKFPTLSFTSTHVDKVDPGTARVTGNLTMLGVTKQIALTVKINADSTTLGRAFVFVATGTINRSEFGMVSGLPIIDDALEITVKTRALSDE